MVKNIEIEHICSKCGKVSILNGKNIKTKFIVLNKDKLSNYVDSFPKLFECRLKITYFNCQQCKEVNELQIDNSFTLFLLDECIKLFKVAKKRKTENKSRKRQKANYYEISKKMEKERKELLDDFIKLKSFIGDDIYE